MNIETLRSYCLQKENVEEALPFGPETLVFKVDGKIFLLVSLDTPEFRFNVKCDPDKAITLRETFPAAVIPGFHMNKKHWNTIMVTGTRLTEAFLREQIDHSYELVRKNHKKK